MMPEEWPIAPPAAGKPTSPARDAGRGRLGTVRVDFFLDPDQRLTEQERALMTAMLHCLVGDVADEVRSSLPDGVSAANDESNLALIEGLTRARLLDHPTLMALLLRRADEERISSAARARGGRREARVLQGLVSHESGAVSAAAMALILARGRRRDRFGQCLLNFDDLPSDVAEVLAHSVAAGLRHDLAAVRGVAEADRMLASAAANVIGKHDRESGLDSLTAELTRILDEEGALGHDLIVAAGAEGEMSFVAQVLSRRAGLASDVAMDELLSGSERRAMALLRMADVPREVAASLLAGIGDLLGLDDVGSAISIFDRLDAGEVETARSWLATGGDYKAAAVALENGNGKRAL